jgi:dTDP-4-dehydrorhamnose reductase
LPADPEAGKGRLEIWAGPECTVNRVGDTYYDQLERSSHAHRLDDLERLAELGIRTLRYPVLWERTAPNGLESADWSWADERLGRLRELGVRPIVGLVHHGSGPRDTSLLDPAFPERLAAYAGAVARRYPEVEAYTPVNEPLTTARFSALYGHWYPHARSAREFPCALLHECRATVLAMRAIREVNPAARLVQTDDLGKTYATPRLRYQAEFENERRWLTWDLLSGRLDRRGLVWKHFETVGLPANELTWFWDNPCPPDIIGINHYLTSERVLDERLELFPEEFWGGNGRDRYADVPAVRVGVGALGDLTGLLGEVWERYRRPIAITEVHNGCTREEQLRWLRDIWESAGRARAAGRDVRAVTAWAVFGAFNWHTLVTRQESYYEPGAFDLLAPNPRPTAIAGMLRELAAGQRPSHPVLDSNGWWKRPGNWHFSAAASALEQGRASGPLPEDRPAPAPSLPTQRPLLITGQTGTLGRAFARLAEVRGLEYRLLARGDLDIADREAVERVLTAIQPWAVLNSAGYVRVDDAEREPERCARENTIGPGCLAEACAAAGLPLVTFSSDLVFDGQARQPYVESSPVHPLNVYGRTKAEAERRVGAILPDALIVRTSAFFGPWDDYNFVTIVLRELAAGRPFIAANDAVVSPTYVPDLVNATLDLLIDGAQGIWHLANEGAVTWYDLASTVARTAGLDTQLLEGQPTERFGLAASRPAYSVLGSERAWLMPTLDHALARYFQERVA